MWIAIIICSLVIINMLMSVCVCIKLHNDLNCKVNYPGCFKGLIKKCLNLFPYSVYYVHCIVANVAYVSNLSGNTEHNDLFFQGKFILFNSLKKLAKLKDSGQFNNACCYNYFTEHALYNASQCHN